MDDNEKYELKITGSRDQIKNVFKKDKPKAEGWAGVGFIIFFIILILLSR